MPDELVRIELVTDRETLRHLVMEGRVYQQWLKARSTGAIPPRLSQVHTLYQAVLDGTVRQVAAPADTDGPMPDAAPVSDREYFTTDEFADLLRVHKRTVERQIETGALPSLQIGNCRRIPRSALDDLLSKERSC